MSEQTPYQLLEVDEDASFDEVQEARTRLAEQHSGDKKRLESIEVAYDAILMDRLRQRQEGKIKVPERIRFPERLTPPPASFTPSAPSGGPAWLQRLIDTPSRADILWPAGVYVGLGGLSIYPAANDSLLQLTLALGVGSCLYFLNRKEQKFGRAVLLTVAGLVVGLLLGGLLGPLLSTAFITTEKFIALFTFLILWLVSSFLR
ncbi:MAG: CPP1-like family protein [Microcoleus sp. PH2017_10_PVI_O_A]|uniref:CPP1-like family protein n=1 Tax=unclassified Microcoleus TaxID=2642155 RepID=UPI001D2936B5|nr:MULTISPECIES: CPP1-like family protein [unclassified Microcoleus]TAE76425.1 MAG: molecular chaperone DnaJ [Oscillatoriales cyanobacterium]MCC3409326.1 CPP1-like family protein [Microcoleus sp. PH2017_10_PVI_O_A]MCC3463563.1 CPP1-like family protein [Microcoleus sp. PH2017_11_PCY_U_A]MCC3481897.1 CPP1-like family protein [Microcoleus sp. PH2017_12_PCY_D_A]MCC3527608.1 CPP1-like family protein [Microcoleus sp. PH2017_21_RUC_O_A]